ncbi:MAG: hypothetical protein ACRCXL_09860 [Dermatophilaceae bacterium]
MGGLALALRKAGWITLVCAKLWLRDTTRSLGLGPVTVRVLLVVVGTLVGAGFCVATAITPSVDPQGLPAEAAADLRETTASLVWTVAVVTAAIFLMISPRRTALADLLILLPVSRTAAAVSTQLLVLIAAALTTVLCSGPLLKQIVAVSGPEAGWALIAGALMVGGALPATWAVFNVAVFSLQAVRVPQHYALAASGLVCAVGGVTPTALKFTGAHLAWSPNGLSASVFGGSQLPLVFLAVWCAAGVTTFVLLAGRLPADPVVAPSRMFESFGVPNGKRAVAVWFEVVVLARAPQYAATVVFTLMLMLGLIATWTVNGSVVLGVVLSFSFAPLYLASVQSFGHTRPTHWISAYLTARHASWAWPKALACLSLSVALSASAGVPAAVVGVLRWTELAVLGVQLLPMWAVALVVGVIVPYNTEQPLSIGLSAGLAGATATGTVLALQQAAPTTPAGESMVTLGATAVFLGAYVLLARRVRLDVRV